MKKKLFYLSIAIVCFIIVSLLVFWKWPNPLLSHFRAIEPIAGSIVLMRDQGDNQQVDFYEAPSLQPLWDAMQQTKIRHIGGYDIIPIEDALFHVFVNARADGQSHPVTFDCTPSGTLYIGKNKYKIFGSSDLPGVLAQYFDTESIDSKDIP